MQLATSPSFTERLCAVYDLEHPFHDPRSRVRRAEVIEYIDAFSVERPPCHPTTFIEWDLIRTFGVSEGRRLFLRASQRWDAKPIRARDIVQKWSWDAEPQAWVDGYLVEVIDTWRSECARLREQAIRDADQAAADARMNSARERGRALERAYKEEDWRPFAGQKWPAHDVVAWCAIFGRYSPSDLDDAETIIESFETKLAQHRKFAADMRARRIPNPGAPREPAASPEPRLGFGGYAMPSRSKFRRK
jgi:hypothetical protein